MPQQFKYGITQGLLFNAAVRSLSRPQGPSIIFVFINGDSIEGKILFPTIFLLKLTRALCDIFCVNKANAMTPPPPLKLPLSC